MILDPAETGKSTVGFFHARMGELYPEYRFTFSELVSYFDALNPWFFETFGKAVGYATSLSAFEIRGSMESVADASKGNLPAEPRDLIVFYDALLKNYDQKKFSFWKRLGGEVASATVDDVKTAAVTVATVAAGGIALYGLAAVVLFALAYKGKK